MDEKTAAEELRALVGTPLREIQEEFISVAEMQRHIMPDPERLAVFGDYDIFGMTLPTAIVGGDFYDFIDLESRFGIRGKMGIVIADAAGHGLAAAMLVRDFNTALFTGISFQSYYVQDTTTLLFEKINRRMYRSSRENQYISAFYGELWLDGRLRYINAGQYMPLLFNQRGIVELDVGGPVLGAFHQPSGGYAVGEVRMQPGSVLACYTDGIVEAFDGAQEYTVERLKEIICAIRQKSSREIFSAVIQDVEDFSRQSGQTDDRTLIIIKKKLVPDL